MHYLGFGKRSTSTPQTEPIPGSNPVQIQQADTHMQWTI